MIEIRLAFFFLGLLRSCTALLLNCTVNRKEWKKPKTAREKRPPRGRREGGENMTSTQISIKVDDEKLDAIM